MEFCKLDQGTRFLDVLDKVDFSEVECLDGPSKDAFRHRAFKSGQPLRLGGKIRIWDLPDDFDANIFECMGLMVVPEIADTLKQLVPHEIQLFPVACEGDPQRFFYVNLTRTFNCVDEVRSGADYNSRTGKPYSLKQIVLTESAIDKHASIFTINILTGAVIVRDRLRRELLKRHSIRGSSFLPLEST